MEIELKYSLPDSPAADSIWDDPEIDSMRSPLGGRRSECLNSVYYDTEDLALLKHGIAFRIRKTGSLAVAAVKWDGKSDGALHIRGELERELGQWRDDIVPDMSIFEGSDIGKTVSELTSGHKMIPLFTTEMRRRSMLLLKDGCVSELAIDEGKIIAGTGVIPISEAEIELIEGDRKGLLEIGGLLRDKYGLLPEHESKFARGLKLIKLK